MTRYLLDTNIIILFLAGDERTVHLLSTLAVQTTERFCVSTVTEMELWDGTYAAPDPVAASAQRHAFLDEVAILPFDSDVARRGAKLRYDLRQAGIRTRERGLDLQIAATALHYGLALVTYNVGDYDDIPELAIHPIEAMHDEA